ncbi:recombinase family protein [Nonomuraea sp. NPDC001023]|uniref:recombinase family protein n=1 Tax=unclassified Nonomuraea TaxID=2593643 RepID=UPI0033258119
MRIGYARASTVRQSLDTQLDSLKAASVTRVFFEKISTRATARPELDKAVVLAGAAGVGANELGFGPVRVSQCGWIEDGCRGGADP